METPTDSGDAVFRSASETRNTSESTIGTVSDPTCALLSEGLSEDLEGQILGPPARKSRWGFETVRLFDHGKPRDSRR